VDPDHSKGDPRHPAIARLALAPPGGGQAGGRCSATTAHPRFPQAPTNRLHGGNQLRESHVEGRRPRDDYHVIAYSQFSLVRTASQEPEPGCLSQPAASAVSKDGTLDVSADGHRNPEAASRG